MRDNASSLPIEDAKLHERDSVQRRRPGLDWTYPAFTDGCPSMIPDGLTTLESKHGPKETMDRLAAAVTARGMAVLARIDHAEAAAKAGLNLRPTEVLIFGNPKAGTLLMQVTQMIGIDLPLKALVWEDEAGKCWLGYIEPAWLAKRYAADAGTDAVQGAMSAAIAAVAKEATS